MAAATPPVIFFVVCGMLHVDAGLFDRGRKVLIVKGMKMCKGDELLPLRWEDVVVRRDRTTKDLTLSLRLVITKEITGPFSMEFNFLKCDRSGNLGSCEYVVKGYRNKEICKHMVEKNQVWSMFLEAFDKPVTCPMKPGEHKINNLVTSSEVLKKLPLPEGFWKLTLSGYEGEVKISCIEFEALIKREQ